MTNSAGAVQNGLVLRLSVPAAGELAALGRELAIALAEQIGISRAKKRVGEALAELTRAVDPSGESASIGFEFHKLDAALRIEARLEDRSSTVTIPLAA